MRMMRDRVTTSVYVLALAIGWAGMTLGADDEPRKGRR